ncbi:MAG: transglycosylase domain-containing protein [Verrucomicrobiales bacterium]|nr:transglycosylase domain-containing protein [Verrucomicrobiota bacterium JB025]
MSTWRPIGPQPLWKRLLPEFMHGPVILLFQFSLVALAIAAGVAFFYFLLAMRYDLADVAKLPAATTFYDRKQQEIIRPGGDGRKLVRRDDIPDFLVKALLAREDARFFEHPGVDFRGVARATIRNLKDMDFTQGASTLTMQLTRNSFQMTGKSLHRKMLEIATTLRVERRYTKDEILTHYLNRIYFGAGADGIGQAATTYFGKPTRDLSESECAMLVGIIRGPHLFSPFRNPDGALDQRNQTLARMGAMGFITAEELKRFSNEKPKLLSEKQRAQQGSYALRAVDRELDRILDKAETQLGGLHVYTTLDSDWQSRLERDINIAVQAIEQESGWNHPTHADYQPGSGDAAYLQFAAVTTETLTGRVLALIGGRDFRHSRWDRCRSSRDLGTAFEPIVAAAAAERGKLVLKGRPVQTGRQIGPAEVIRIAKRCGLSGPFVETEDLFRGAVAASPMEMATALATIGNTGIRTKPLFIREIRDSSGSLIYQSESELTKAISPEAANDAASTLSHTGATRCFTGATGSERDAWVLRLGPTGSTAIWLGFDQPTKITSEKRLNALLAEIVQRLGND